jgi:hypothetical protein
MTMVEIQNAEIAARHVPRVINPPQIAPDVLEITYYTRILVILPVWILSGRITQIQLITFVVRVVETVYGAIHLQLPV